MSRTLTARLKHKIIIEEQVEAFNEVGNLVINYLEYAKLYAEINPIYNHTAAYLENFQFMQIISQDIYMVKIRYLMGLNSKMRIRYKDKILNIKRIINPYEENKILKIIAQMEN